MALQCNIDARGKLIRLICGVMILVLGIVLTALWAWPGGSAIAWIVAVLCILAGAFAIFESRAGWCAARAMGMKTPF